MKKNIAHHIEALLATILISGLLTACSIGGKKQPEKVVDLYNNTWIMEKYFGNVTGYDRVEYEQIYYDWNDRLAAGPTDYRFRGVICFTEAQADDLWDQYQWTQVAQAPDFEFDKVSVDDIGTGPWYECKQFEQDNLSAVNVAYAVFDGSVLVFDFQQY